MFVRSRSRMHGRLLRSLQLVGFSLFYLSNHCSAQYAFSIGGDSRDDAMAVSSDSQGNIYVTGWFSSTVDFDPDPVNSALLKEIGLSDLFLASYSTSGDYQWAFNIGGEGTSTLGNDIQTYPGGGEVVTGFFRGETDFDPDPDSEVLLSIIGFEGAIFVARYDGEGDFVWAFPLGGPIIDPVIPGSNSGEGVAVSAAGDIAVTGSFRTFSDFDPDSTQVAEITCDRGACIFLARYGPNAEYRWAFEVDGGDNVPFDTGYSADVAFDFQENAYMTGVFLFEADFDPDEVGEAVLVPIGGNGGTPDVFLASYGVAGEYRWAFNLGSPGEQTWGTALAVDAAGNLYLGGELNGPTDLDPDPVGEHVLTPLSAFGNGFLASYTPSGAFRWAFLLGSLVEDVSLDASGHLLTTGSFSDSFDFDPDPLATAILTGSSDPYVASYTADGMYRWAIPLNSEAVPGAGKGQGIAPRPGARLAVVGHFRDSLDVNPSPDEHLLVQHPDDKFFNDMFVAAYLDGGGFPVAGEEEPAVPTAFALLPAYPNPFNPSATIPFTLPEAANVALTVYDVLGRRIATLADGRYEAGRHEAILDGSRLASGLYIVRGVMEPESPGSTQAFTQRLTLLR